MKYPDYQLLQINKQDMHVSFHENLISSYDLKINQSHFSDFHFYTGWYLNGLDIYTIYIYFLNRNNLAG